MRVAVGQLSATRALCEHCAQPVDLQRLRTRCWLRVRADMSSRARPQPECVKARGDGARNIVRRSRRVRLVCASLRAHAALCKPRSRLRVRGDVHRGLQAGRCCLWQLHEDTKGEERF